MAIYNHLLCSTQPRMTLARTLKLFKLPEEPQTPGLRPLTKQDVTQVLISSHVSLFTSGSRHGGCRALTIMSHPCQQLLAALLILELRGDEGTVVCSLMWLLP